MSRRIAALLALAFVFAAPANGVPAHAPCGDAFRAGVLCDAAFEEATQLIRARPARGAAYVIEDVQTGAVVSRGALIQPDDANAIETTTSILPLSVAKLFLAASLWTHHEGDALAERGTLDRRITDMLLHSDDAEGRRLAHELRSLAGTDGVLGDLARYGVGACTASPGKDTSFWRFTDQPDDLPVKGCTTLGTMTNDIAWDNAFSLGEANFSLTLLHLSRFMQAIGNDGVMIAPELRSDTARSGERRETVERTVMVSPAVAALLRGAMRETVERGTARGVKGRLRGGWQLVGKTGSSGIHGEPLDGIFVGLVSDPSGKARYAFAIYVEKGGLGGGAAAELICDIFNFALGL